MTTSQADLPREYRDLLDSTPEALIPFYRQSAPDQPIGLYRGTLRELHTNSEVVYNGTVFLAWRPTPWVRFRATDPVPFEFERLFDPEFELGPFDVNTVPHQVELGDHDAEMIEGQVRTLSIGSATEVASVAFQVPNFNNFLGELIRADTATYRSRLELSATPWRVTLDGRQDLSEQEKVLRRQGGHLLTHSGLIRQADGAPFTTADAEEILEALFYLLSFARGAFTGPMLPVGFTNVGEPVWARWTSTSVDPWSTNVSWLDDLHSGALIELFPGFMARWREQAWRKAMRLAIHYYVTANRTNPIQLAVATSQIVLQLLGTTVLARPLDHLLPSRPAGGTPRHLLRYLGIPEAIPSELEALTDLAKERGWNDGPWAIAELRKEVVHLSIAREEIRLQAWIDGWKLAMWYIELSLLRVCGFGGEYASRLRRRWQGQVEPVPWS